MIGVTGSTRNTKRRAAAAGRLGSNLAKRLAVGLLIDRTQKHVDGKSRKKIAAPDVLAKFFKKP